MVAKQFLVRLYVFKVLRTMAGKVYIFFLANRLISQFRDSKGIGLY